MRGVHTELPDRYRFAPAVMNRIRCQIGGSVSVLPTSGVTQRHAKIEEARSSLPDRATAASLLDATIARRTRSCTVRRRAMDRRVVSELVRCMRQIRTLSWPGTYV